MDYGDANNPDPAAVPPTCTQYPTRIGCNGARHGLGSSLVLGASADSDGGNGYGVNADTDDVTGMADEEGVMPTASVSWTAGGQGSLAATVTGGSGFLNCWVDWNNDKDWADAGEKILSDSAVASGPNTKGFNIPSGVTIPNSSFIARCRLAPGANQATAVTGATEFGEVEDHKWSFDAAGVPILAAAPSAVTNLAIAASGTVDVGLTWTNPAPNNAAHVVAHLTNPYFTSASGGLSIDTIVNAAPWAYTHGGVRGAPAGSAYYLVYGRLGTTDAATASNRVGLFEFSLTPGQ
jgi:hypothetical protein